MSFIEELKRRNVIRVAIAYAVVVWLIAQVAELAPEGLKREKDVDRKRVLTVVCTDNPYETVWQPAEGTCELFTASN